MLRVLEKRTARPGACPVRLGLLARTSGRRARVNSGSDATAGRVPRQDHPSWPARRWRRLGAVACETENLAACDGAARGRPQARRTARRQVFRFSEPQAVVGIAASTRTACTMTNSVVDPSTAVEGSSPLGDRSVPASAARPMRRARPLSARSRPSRSAASRPEGACD